MKIFILYNVENYFLEDGFVCVIAYILLSVSFVFSLTSFSRLKMCRFVLGYVVQSLNIKYAAQLKRKIAKAVEKVCEIPIRGSALIIVAPVPIRETIVLR